MAAIQEIFLSMEADSQRLEDAIDVEFKFETDEDSSNDEDGDEDISGVPEVGSIWNDCIVAASNKSSDGSGTDLLLMSLEEWESQIATARSVPEAILFII